MMPWQTILLIRFAAANLAAPVLLKKIADNASKSWLQFWMFFYCALFAIIFFIATQNCSISSLFGLFLFKEVKNISIIEIIALAASVLGGFIIAFNF